MLARLPRTSQECYIPSYFGNIINNTGVTYLKIAVLSDIHSNHAALEACYNYIDQQDVDGIFYLGDYVTDCPYPQKTMALINEYKRKYRSWFIKGNREDYLLTLHYNPDDELRYSQYSGTLFYTYENLSKSDLEFFESCDILLKVEIPGYAPLTLCHGSPASAREMLLPGSENTDSYLEKLDTDYLICGHTHHQCKYIKHGKMLVNPGTVGLPLNNQPKPQFAILHSVDSGWEPELISIDYDIDKILRDFEPSGIYEKAEMWSKAIYRQLETGTKFTDKLGK